MSFDELNEKLIKLQQYVSGQEVLYKKASAQLDRNTKSIRHIVNYLVHHQHQHKPSHHQQNAAHLRQVFLSSIEKSELSENSKEDKISNEPKSKREQIVEITIKFIKDSTLKGLPKIFERRGTNYKFLNPMKIVWAVLLVISFVLCLVTVDFYITDFQKNDVITQINKSKQTPTDFPAITFCNTESDALLEALQCWFQSKTAHTFDYFREYNYQTSEFLFCMRFNMYNESNTLKSGSVGPSDGLSCNLNTDYTDLQKFKIYITDNKINAFSQELAYSLNYNVNNKFEFKKQLDIKLPEPFNPCQIKERSYSDINCQQECMVRLIHDTCDCTFPGYYMRKETSNCTERGTFFQATKPNDCYEYYKEEMKRTCEIECPMSCRSLAYEVTSFVSWLNAPDNTNMTNLEFYFNSLNVLKILEVKKITVFSTLSQIGGSISLFLGISLLSLLEVLELVLVIVLILIGPKYAKHIIN